MRRTRVFWEARINQRAIAFWEYEQARNPSVINSRSVSDRNLLSPTRDLVSANGSAVVVDRSSNRLNPVVSANASFLNGNQSFEQAEERRLIKAFESSNH